MHEADVERNRYHIKLIGECLSSIIGERDRDHHYIPLVIAMNWNEADRMKVDDIFDEYSAKLEESRDKNDEVLRRLMSEFKAALGFHSSTIKQIILAYYRDGRWEELCEQYALAFECVEFHEITKKVLV